MNRNEITMEVTLTGVGIQTKDGAPATLVLGGTAYAFDREGQAVVPPEVAVEALLRWPDLFTLEPDAVVATVEDKE